MVSIPPSERISPLELFHPDGVVERCLILGANCPEHLRPEKQCAAGEMAVARLQADFVSAVSHELRTPLTALQQFSELLVAGRVADENAAGGRLHERAEAFLGDC